MEKILSGKPVAKSILQDIESQLLNLHITPTLALVIAGNDPASAYYVKNIMHQGSKLGFQIIMTELPETVTEKDFVDYLIELNNNSRVNGIMIQKPLPKHINEDVINDTINPDKDVDGINPLNLGKLFMAQDCFIPGTAAAVIELLKYYEIETKGQHIVILGRSEIVAKPLAGLLLHKAEYGNATVTICHSYTKNLDEITKTADILISAIGKPRFVKSQMIKEQAICIDVGINLFLDEEKGDIYVGDFDYNDCFDKALAITPVPGGIGSITTSILLKNLLKAAFLNNS